MLSTLTRVTRMLQHVPKPSLTRAFGSSDLSSIEVTDEAQEIKIEVPWGHISGKWWGPREIRPIVCLHGWQDNAGTFDTLIPLLPQDFSYLALDLPGHGWSSRFPAGMNYNALDHIILLERIRTQFKWSKMSLMSHSMGSVISFNYAGIFPDTTDFVIGIDALKSHIRRPHQVPTLVEASVHKLLQADAQNSSDSEPPSYEIQEMIDKWHDSTGGSVTKECVKYLMKRNIKESTRFPGKYYFARDSRWKYAYSIHIPQDVTLEMTKRMQMPYLFIKATNSPYYEDKAYFTETIQAMRTHNPNFQWHLVEGTHHLHLTHPKSVSKLISTFLCKNRQRSKL